MYYQEIQQSQTSDQSTNLRGRTTEHLHSQDTRETIKVKQPALSSSSS